MILYQTILQILNFLVVSALLTTSLCLILRRFAFKLSLVDRPDQRKVHNFDTPLVGGISIFLTSLILLMIFDEMWIDNVWILFIFASLYLFLGIADDLLDLQAGMKLFFQILIATVFIVTSKLCITNLGIPIGYTKPLELGILSIPITLLAIVGFTNAINMIDGCDGLAVGLLIIPLLALILFGSWELGKLNNIFLLTLLFSLIIFLFFNFSSNRNLKIFLGDGGTLFLGFIVASNLIQFAEKNTTYDPSIVLWFIAVPLYDFCTVIFIRFILNRKIMVADRSHIHHFLLSKNFTHFQTTLLIVLSAVALLFIGVLITLYYHNLSILIFFLIFILYLSFRIFSSKAN